MKRSAIIVLLLLGLAGAGPAVSSVRAEDLTVALSSLSTETLDPVLGGHIVKFYLDQIFDYLVGVTPDGQLSADDGIATRWENRHRTTSGGRSISAAASGSTTATS